LPPGRREWQIGGMPEGTITVFLADDNLIVREGVRALLEMEDDIAIVGVASDFDELVAGAEAANPNVVVTDIRMPPHFRREGIDAAVQVRKRHPGTGVVILSQFDDPEYAISLLAEGAAGYAYLLKDRVGEGDQLAMAVREVAGGGSMLDPKSSSSSSPKAVPSRPLRRRSARRRSRSTARSRSSSCAWPRASRVARPEAWSG
jgi:DNA-binding NarL/FixJ family response regulator